jgi:hypothetical protein
MSMGVIAVPSGQAPLISASVAAAGCLTILID